MIDAVSRAVLPAPRSAPDEETYDLVVIGAGAAGLTAALVAAHRGLRVVIVEKTAFVGGTTARSGGAAWVPDSPQARAAGRPSDVEQTHRYLDALVGNRAPRELRETYLRAAPEMVNYLARHGDVRFELAAGEHDYRSELPGASTGRVLRPLPFDGRRLGKNFSKIAPPLPELMVFGGMMVTRAELITLLSLPSAAAMRLGARLVARYAADRLRYPRGTRLVLGNALVAALFHALDVLHVPVLFNTVPTELCVASGRVTGVRIRKDSRSTVVHARRGVVLAGGGFPGSPQLRDRLLPHPTPLFTTAFEACTGDTLELAQSVKAACKGSEDNAYWFPSSTIKRDDGSNAVFPHIALDRAKPGLIAVGSDGRRFVDEATSYHEFVRAMYRGTERGVHAVPAHLVCDHDFLRRYGLGVVPPRAMRLRRFVDSGYLARGASIEELAARIRVDASGLAESVTRHNRFALSGVDEDFGKGSTAYGRSNGDPTHRPNPCLAPIKRAPYFSVRVWPTPLATSFGVRINNWGQALDTQGNAIDGLYACGNDMESVMGGEYPGAGAQIGPAMTFGYLAATHAANSAAHNKERQRG